MSSPLPSGGETLLHDLESATARLSGLNPGDFAVVRDALAERALAIERLIAWIAACRPPLDPDPGLAARIAMTLATGAQLAVRLTLVRASVSTQIAGMARGKRLLDTLTRAPAGATSPALDFSG